VKDYRAPVGDYAGWREQVFTRRQVLLAAVGGSVAALFGMRARAEQQDVAPWPVIRRVQQLLFPDEPGAPGAGQINALGYLQGVVDDPLVGKREREFVVQGVVWLEELARQNYGAAFLELEAATQDELLVFISGSDAGENWLSTLLTYIFEALLSAPVYGGNPQGVGWKWLAYTPGFPLPDAATHYRKLPR